MWSMANSFPFFECSIPNLKVRPMIPWPRNQWLAYAGSCEENMGRTRTRSEGT